MSRKKKRINDSGIPDHAIDAIARAILPAIIEYYESEEGQREYEEWLKTPEGIKAKEKYDNE